MQVYTRKKAKEAKNFTQALREVKCSLEVNTAKYIRSSHLSVFRFFVFFSCIPTVKLASNEYDILSWF